MKVDWIDDPQGVRHALAALSEDEARREPGPHLAAHVLAAWDRAHVPARRAGAPWHAWWPLAATVALSLLALQGLATRDASPPLIASEWSVVTGAGGGIMPAVFTVSQPAEAWGRVTIVHVQVPVEHLVSVGVTPPADSRPTVTLELVVGEDGVARTARLTY